MPRIVTNSSDAVEYQQQQEIDAEKGYAVATEEPVSSEQDPELRPGHKIHYGLAVIDVLISLLPLYFVVFGILAYVRDGTLASSFRNMAILKMAAFNPTLFPIIFTLIMAKFLKAAANWKLERGTTVGLVQHLLGSRSLVSSVMTPIKLRTTTFLVPLLVLMWVLNPISGQTSLRVVSKQSNLTEIATPFHYLDLLSSSSLAQNGDAIDSINVDFNSALSSPVSSKNGSQDIYSNLMIPLIEDLADRFKDSEGWITTMDTNINGVMAAVVDALDLQKDSPQLLYSSLLGIPITRGGSTSTTATSNSTEAKLDKIKEDLFGPDIVSTQGLFNFETSYLYANCSVKKSAIQPSVVDLGNVLTVNKTNWNASVGETVSNNNGLTIAYDSSHDVNSTQARRIGLESWLGIDGSVRYTWNADLSEAWCELTTTYLEVQAYCMNEQNCTVSKLRKSQKPHPDPILTVFDGVQTSDYTSPTEYANDDLINYRDSIPIAWFGDFINSTFSQNVNKGPHNQVPLEAYFHDTVTPHYYANNGNSENPYPQPLHDIGNELFSTRMTQLLNTYWLASVAPYTIVGGITYYPDPNVAGAISNAKTDGSLATSQGSFYVETMVLRCHKVYLGILLTVSFLLFLAGLVTAYLDATRKGPDVLDDFVNSLRHSPYVHVEQGPSMEDGQDKARRLRETKIQMGDVSPGGDYGYVAIGTPSAEQPVEVLSHKRYYQ